MYQLPRSTRTFLLLSLIATIVGAIVPVAQAQTLYVATDGNDAWSGSLDAPDGMGTDGPLATLTGARDRLRVMRANSEITGPVQVLVRGGSYPLTDPVVMAPQDSGTTLAPVTFEAYPSESPIIHGGIAVTGWVQEGPYWTAQVPPIAGGVWPFTSLWVDGERRTPARTPNQTHIAGDFPTDEDFFFAAGQLTEPDGMGGELPSTTRFQYRPGDLETWSSLPDAHVVIFHAWSTSLLPVQALDTANQIVTFAGPSRYAFGYWRSDQWYYVEHLLEGLDVPGEWYVERATGKLYYMPMAGEDMATAEVIVPVAEKLLVFSGAPGSAQYVEHLNFRGLRFGYTNFALPAAGISESQSAASVEAAIDATGARFCTFERCEFMHLGTSAIWLKGGCQDNTIFHSEFHDLGAGGIKIGRGTSPASPAWDTVRNTVDNNYLHDGGRIIREAAGVWIGRSSNNAVTHNDISDFRYSGVSVGWQWGYDATTARDNLIEDNRIHHLGKAQLADMGGIYTLGVSPGTVVRRNLVHDVASNPKLYGGWGLYADEGSSEIRYENNIVYNTESGGFHQHYGQNNLIQNNYFVYSNAYQLRRTLDEAGHSFDFLRNIVYFNNGQLLGLRWDDNEFFFDYNLYWDTSGQDLDFASRTWAQWQADGMDLNSLNQDPRFANPLQADFSLLPGSPAVALGINPIDTTQIGLYGEQEWIDKPTGVIRDPFEPPDYSRIDEDFETTTLGSVALDASTRGEEPGASVRVTDEFSRSGTQSLKFVDPGGLSQHYYPYVAYFPIVNDGTATGRISIRFEPGTVLYYEWRDDHEPYRAGPSIWTDALGNLRVRGQTLMALPADTWITFTITCLLGDEADGTYQLEVHPEGAEPVLFEGLECPNPDFDRINWLGIVSDADTPQTFYVDDIHLARTPPESQLPLGPWTVPGAMAGIGLAALRIRNRRRTLTA